MIPRSAFTRQLPRAVSSRSSLVAFSSTASVQNASSPDSQDAPARPHTIDPRWLTMMKRRIGKCMMFGLRSNQVEEGGKVLQQLAKDWRGLIAGSEGFLIDERRRGLYQHNVVWGEQGTTPRIDIRSDKPVQNWNL
ncbi:hypothetical protein N7478_006544 [Penicillium angulare]|uniref:uncharacterized protein n=1 Tax=Penicillium angulare TaxID=116970 RepID=UPI002541BEEA|nr:uncharacterized protein N7478_006544 [Penicillium angulare]KAJ5281172.1 hypothetical protein N7478_006544 [Penicillium angulare]